MPTVYDGLFPDGTLLTAPTRPRTTDDGASSVVGAGAEGMGSSSFVEERGSD
jgi:hypothetical protein